MQFISRKSERKQKFFLFMTVFMIVVTTVFMFLGFYVMPVSRFNLLFIIGITTMGYLIALLYYNNYLTIKKEKNARNY